MIAAASRWLSDRSAPLARSLVLALVACPAAAWAQLPAGVPTLAPMIERVSPTVVNISVSGEVQVNGPLTDDPLFKYFFPDTPESRPVQSAGSGVIVDAAKGYVLTNAHVIENAEKITVTLLDNRSMEAKIIGSDPGTDLAVLKVEAADLKQAEFGDSDRLRVGDFVVAIGNPFGFSHTVTSGIVSGLGRKNINPDAYENFIQTDASINPGNSGGALLDLEGKLVGINSAIISRGGGNIGIGFAIPVNMARDVMQQLIDFGHVSRGLLGVTIQSVTPEVAEMYGLHDVSGALVMSVAPNSAAEKAGLQFEDVILSVDGQAVRDSASLRTAIGLKRPGSHVKVGIVREGRERTLEAELGEAEAAETAALPVPKPESSDGGLDPAFEGAELAPADRTKPNSSAGGLSVVSVEEGSPAAMHGLKAGDVITHINRQRVRNLQDAERALKDARSVIVQVQRGSRGLLLLMR
ncbi:MAG TPA: DegQ family serine endoprotease [Gammaproteobacteria bacterium]|nr:DegQ family serine endoprotease [Gammaproteobacteria bacterium]